MALNASALSSLIVATWTSDHRCGFSSPLRQDQADMVAALSEAIASAVVSHIISAAVVVGTSATGGAVTGTVT